MEQIQVRSLHDSELSEIDVRLSIGTGDTEAAYDDKRTDNAGNTAFPVVLPSTNGYTLHFNTKNVKDKYLTDSKFVQDWNGTKNVKVKLARTLPKRIMRDGYYFKDEDGRNHYVQGESAFLDYYRLLRGEDIRQMLRRSEILGSNCRRNFLMTLNTGNAAGIGPQEPEIYGNDFYDKFPELLDLYAEYGLHGYFSVFPDNQLFGNWNGNNAKQLAHWNKLGEIAKAHKGVFALELTNEPDAHTFNQVDVNNFQPISGVLCCIGSHGDTGGALTPAPQWDFIDFHQPRHYPNSVMDANIVNHPNRLQQGACILLGEPLGFGDKNLNSNREDRPRIAKEMSGAAKGVPAGIFYHSTHGAFSQLYDNIEMDCAIEWFSVGK